MTLEKPLLLSPAQLSTFSKLKNAVQNNIGSGRNLVYMLRLREKLIFKEISAFSELLLCLSVFVNHRNFSCISWYGHLDC